MPLHESEQSRNGPSGSGPSSRERPGREQYRADQSFAEPSRGGPYGEESRAPSGAGQAYREQSRGPSDADPSRGGPYGEEPRAPSGAGQAYREQSRGPSDADPSRGGPYGEGPRAPSGAGQAYREQSRGPSDADLYWLRETIALSRRCRPSQTAFSVGAVIVAADGTPLATGYSREADPRDHAEEAALGKLARGDPRLAGATLYSSLEPCGVRASRPRPCAELIIAARIPRVVYAWREPPLLATGGGADMLRAAGVSVTEVPELAAEARQVNAHLTRTPGPPSH